MLVRIILCGIVFGTMSIGYGQIPDGPLTIEERLTSFENQIAALDTRLNTRTTVGAGSLGSSESGLAAQIRIDMHEREVGDLTREVRDLSRQVATARREASEARREARDALSRIR